MLLVPTVMIILAVAFEPLRLWMINNIWLYYVCAFTAIGMLLSLLCFYKVLKKVPANYIFLSVFTVLESYTVAFFTCYFEPRYILYAAILTAAMSLSLSLYACFTKTDLTGIASTLCWVSLGVSLAAMILMLIIQSDILVIILCWIFLIIAALYLIVDTQMIVGGRHAELTYDDYIIGAMMIFVDIITIFVYILAILGGRRN